MRLIHRVAAGVCFLAGICSVQGADDSLRFGNTTISGSGQIEAAEILRGSLNNGAAVYPISHIWYGHTIGILAFESKFSDWLRIKGNFEFRQYFNMLAPEYLNYHVIGMQWNEFFVREAYGDLSLFHAGNFSGSLAMGLFPYKYNPDVSNLGEYLFRSGTYPFYLIGEFDRPFADLTGLCAGFNWNGSDNISAHLDILGLTEQEMRPYWDFSVAAIGSVNLYKLLNFGGGIDFADMSPTSLNDTTSTATQYVASNGDTGFYKFTGVKVMWRATIDPFGTIRHECSDLLGKEGGKIYTEGAIIGLKNYPANTANPLGYDNRSQRMPLMVGIKIPSWKILDLLSLEAEHYPSPDPNDYTQVITDGLPLPEIKQSFVAQNYAPSSWYWSFKRIEKFFPYWSLNMQKSFTRHISVIAQASRDHTRWELHPTAVTAGVITDFEDVERGHGDWAGNAKVVFSF